MINIELNKIEHLIIINNKVLTKLFKQKFKDPLNGDDFNWVEDPDVTSFLAFEGYKEGCRFNDVEPELTATKVDVLMSKKAAMQISGYFMQELLEASEYVKANLDSAEKK
jgi:hypothetical protein